MRNENTTPDTAAYRLMYERSFEDLNYEYLYLLVNRFFNSIGVSFRLFLFITTFILFITWMKITNIITNNLFIAFLSFIPFYGLYFFGITIRAAIAVTISYLAIVIFLKLINKRRYLYYYLLITIASGFHISAAIFYTLPIFAQKEYKKSVLFVFLLIIACIPLFNNLIPFIRDFALNYLSKTDVSRLSNYIERASDSMLYSLTLVKNVFFAGIFIALKNRVIKNRIIYNFFLNTYLVGCFLLVLFSFVTAGSRLAMLFLFFEFILITLLYDSSSLKRTYLIIFIFSAIIINFIAIIQKGNGLVW